MNDLRQSIRTLRTERTFQIVLIPIALVILVIGYLALTEAIAWRENRAAIFSLHNELNPLAPEFALQKYDKDYSSAGTIAWNRVFDLSSGPVRSRLSKTLAYIAPGNVPEDFGGEKPWKPDQDTIEYCQSIKPLLMQIDKASKFETPVWEPIFFNGPQTLLPFVQEWRQVQRIVELDFAVAVAQRDAERAMVDLRRMRAIEKAADTNNFTVSGLVEIAIMGMRNDVLLLSLTADLWSENQLKQIAELLSEKFDFNNRYVKIVENERANLASYVQFYSDDLGLVAPSMKQALLLDALKPLSITYDNFSSKVQEKRSERPTEIIGDFLHSWSIDSPQLLEAYRRPEVERRFVATALGIKSYQLKYKAWPKSLNVLSEIGLNATTWSELDGKPFGYTFDDGHAELVRNNLDILRTGFKPELENGVTAVIR